MLKYMVVLVGALVVLAASDEAQARGFRRSRGSCPNGQCYASIPTDAKQAVAINSEAGAAVAAVPAVEAPAVEAQAEYTTNVATGFTATPASYRLARVTRFFRRR